MNKRVFSLLVLVACAASFPVFASVLVKEKAKQIANPNYVPRNPAAPIQQNPSPAAPAAPTAAEPSFSKLVADVAIIKTKAETPPDLRLQLQQDLAAVVQSAPRLSDEILTRLAGDVSTSLAGKKMSTQEQAEIGKDLGLVLYRAKLAHNDIPPLLKSLKDTLESVDVKAGDAQKVIAGLKAAVAELQGGTGKAATK